MKYLWSTIRVKDFGCVVVVITVSIVLSDLGQVNPKLSQDSLQIESPLRRILDHADQVQSCSKDHADTFKSFLEDLNDNLLQINSHHLGTRIGLKPFLPYKSRRALETNPRPFFSVMKNYRRSIVGTDLPTAAITTNTTQITIKAMGQIGQNHAIAPAAITITPMSGYD